MSNLPAGIALLITCEHGGNHIPAKFSSHFTNASSILASHRGYDAGAAKIARSLAKTLNAKLIIATTSRLLVDLNRSVGNPKLFSEWTRKLNSRARAEILARHYFPHRQQVHQWIANAIFADRMVVHIASHSFTPVLEGVARQADIGLLFDPSRPGEKALCHLWQAALKNENAGLTVRRNYPYRGTADGLCTALRKQFSATDYIGVELEINQALLETDYWARLRKQLGSTLARTLTDTTVDLQ